VVLYYVVSSVYRAGTRQYIVVLLVWVSTLTMPKTGVAFDSVLQHQLSLTKFVERVEDLSANDSRLTTCRIEKAVKFNSRSNVDSDQFQGPSLSERVPRDGVLAGTPRMWRWRRVACHCSR
jgi:hypothetical protein